MIERGLPLRLGRQTLGMQAGRLRHALAGFILKALHLVIGHREPPGVADRRPLPVRDHCIALTASAFSTESCRAPQATSQIWRTENRGQRASSLSLAPHPLLLIAPHRHPVFAISANDVKPVPDSRWTAI